MTRLAAIPKSERGRSEGNPRADSVHALKYYAFLSYSHADSEVADWLHDSLERFRTPASLAGRLTANGVIPGRLTPIFRDRHELPASDNLAGGIRDAHAGVHLAQAGGGWGRIGGEGRGGVGTP